MERRIVMSKEKCDDTLHIYPLCSQTYRSKTINHEIHSQIEKLSLLHEVSISLDDLFCSFFSFQDCKNLLPSSFIDLIAILACRIIRHDHIELFDKNKSLLKTDIFHEGKIRFTLSFECRILDSSDTLLHIVDIFCEI